MFASFVWHEYCMEEIVSGNHGNSVCSGLEVSWLEDLNKKCCGRRMSWEEENNVINQRMNKEWRTSELQMQFQSDYTMESRSRRRRRTIHIVWHLFAIKDISLTQHFSVVFLWNLEFDNSTVYIIIFFFVFRLSRCTFQMWICCRIVKGTVNFNPFLSFFFFPETSSSKVPSLSCKF